MKPSSNWSIDSIWGIKKEHRLKVFLISLSFFFLTACQAIWRPLKTSIFISMVGAATIPWVKILLMAPIIPMIMVYSKLVDWLRRHQIFYWFAITHGIAGIVVAILLTNPEYGIANAAKSSHRILGWIFYFLIESFGAFMSAVFWSFANSINNPKDAKKYYGIFAAGAKVGGVLGAGSLYMLTTFSNINSNALLPGCLAVGSILLFCSAIVIFLLMRFVPGYYMHGYEAAYIIEKERKHQKNTFFQSAFQSIEGLFEVFKNPYVFGIMSMMFFYEIIIVILDYAMAISAEKTYNSAAGLTGYYAMYMLLMHALGIVIALFGTSPIQRFLGIRFSLFACPFLSFVTFILILLFPTPGVIFGAFVFLRAMNYGLNHPTREALFIPTTKAIKFKAKAWTDAFGSRASKAAGSALNGTIFQGAISLGATFSLVMTSIWFVVAYFLGRAFQDTVDKNKVIGDDSPNSLEN